MHKVFGILAAALFVVACSSENKNRIVLNKFDFDDKSIISKLIS